MEELLSLSNVSLWPKTLGLLPIPMFNNSSENQFVLLNGSKGNFCLDISGCDNQFESGLSRNYAWSANVGHYVSVRDDFVEVQRWDQFSSSIERYSGRSISSNLEKFHQYLENNSPRQDLSIIAYSIRMFRRIRAVLGNEITGGQALKAFLYFLCCAEEDETRGNIDLSKYSLSHDTLEIVDQINENKWNDLVEEFLKGRQVEGLLPKVSLILRHTSGQLFQEAHYEAAFVNPMQLPLIEILPSPVLLTNPGKSAIGVHFTPSALARTLVEESLRLLDYSKNKIKIFDPACGSGEFLREVLRQLDLKGYNQKVSIIGWDISETACSMARFEIGWELRNVKFPNRFEIDIRCHDSLENISEWPQDIDVILMNPPFVSWQVMNPSQKELLKEILRDVPGARPNLSHAFLLFSARALSQNGVLGAIVPSSVLEGISSEKLRKQLDEILNPSLIARLGSHQLFPGALVDASFYVGKKGDINEPALSFWADYRNTSNSAGLRALRKIRYYSNSQTLPLVNDGYSIYEIPKIEQNKKPWSPRPYSAWKLINSFGRMKTVQDLFTVRQGIRTGCNKAFIIRQDEWSHLPQAERKFFYPAVVNETIKFGFLKTYAYVFFPYGEEKTITTEEQLINSLNSYYHKFLLPNKKRLMERAKIDKDKWWELTWYRTWSLAKDPKIVTTYFGDSGSFAYDEKGKYMVVQGFAWFPKHNKNSIYLNQNLPKAYLAILNSKIFSQLLAASSNHIGGGQWDLSPRYINSIPIPNLWDESFSPELITALSIFGNAIVKGFPNNEDELEEEALRAYNVAPD